MPRSSVVPPALATLLIAALAMSGCGEISDGQPGSPSPSDALRLQINNAPEMEYANGVLPVTVRAHGGTPETVEVFLNGSLLATLLPPFQFEWDTTQLPEGVHQLQARTQWKGHSLLSPKHSVTVDRTGPSVVSRSPMSGLRVGRTTTLAVTFSEALWLTQDEGPTASVQIEGRTLSPRMSLSEDRLTLHAQIDKPEVLPSTGSASVPLWNVRDRAGNHAVHNGLPVGHVDWTWEVDLFHQESPHWSQWPSSGRDGPASVTDRLALVVEPDGAPVAALADALGSAPLDEAVRAAGIVVGRLEDGAWQEVGAPVIAPGASPEAIVSHPRLALGSEGRLVMAFLQRDAAEANPALHVFQWSVDTWAPLGARVNAPDAAALLGAALAVDSEGRPIVAWSAADGVHVHRWEGGGWLRLGDVQRVGTGPEATVSAYAPALSVDGSGGVFLAWAEAESSAVGAGLYVRYWNGSAWEARGGRLLHETQDSLREQATEPALATLPDGRPMATWAEADFLGYHRKVVVAEWVGSAWDLRVVMATGSYVHARERRWPSVAVDGNGHIMVTFAVSSGGYSSGSASGVYMYWHRRGSYATDHISSDGSVSPSTLAVGRSGKPVIAISNYSSLYGADRVTLVQLNE
ncbi:Ig-like domain-containing protein [Myxococcus sp. AM001]|nr:Ig-like domain-containing protein [Myxococcus sp. AM001]